MAITILELAIFRGAVIDSDGGMQGGEIERVGLPFIGGCQRCGACIAAYNASPSQTGYIMCSAGCIGDVGYETCDEANRALFPDEYEWKGIKTQGDSPPKDEEQVAP
jgi:hypothetical protein